jgi:cyclopropane-fatty-acyl-phospholipid synthase
MSFSRRPLARSSSTRPATDPVADQVLPLVDALTTRRLPLAIRAWDGSWAGTPEAPVTVVLHSPLALRHLLWAPGELGLARAHVQGHLDIEGDVFALLDLRREMGAVDDHVRLGLRPSGWWLLARTATRLGAIGRRPPLPAEEARLDGRIRTRRRDTSAVRHHYDVGNEFYRLLLGSSLTYSCAYWAHDHLDLDGAQAAKHELVCRKLDLRPGQRLLDIGCGWGSMAIHAAVHHGARVVGVTLSPEQATLARERVEEAGVADRVDIRIQDYRDLPDEPFDAISSIGMFEHVGIEGMAEYLDALRRLVVPGGRILNHAISRPDPDARAGVDPKSFMGRYVFPDSGLVEVGTVVSGMARARLEVRDVESLREHYARTLRAWVTNLEANWHEAQRLVGPGRARVWRLYLAGCAVGFEENRTSIHQVLAVRPTADGRSGLPATRARMELGRWTPSTPPGGRT